MFKTMGLWFAMNAAIMIVITISFYLVERIFGISLSTHTGGYTGMFISAAIIGFAGSFLSLAISKWMAKRAYKMTFLTEDNEGTFSEKERIVYTTVLTLAKENSIKIPEIGIYEDVEPNAFATGSSKNNSLVGVSTGLLNGMSKDAIEGVVAHEMAHILNGDMVTMTLLQGVLNTFVIFISNILTNIIDNMLDEKMGFFARIGVVIFFQLLLGILASLIASKFSRYREYKADAGSARYVGKDKMIAGLQALKNMQNLASSDEGKMASMQISTKKRTGIMSLLSTHPDLDDRIEALENLRI
ncbi:MAG: protease HtpX [Candidatus Gracilibacteria bacterium]|nr:protease HtpX [Candidatus Gracilibacteria bacterium]MDQ7023502.1 protease HtpX [Candidatus Gracilibacteria bacterium]